MNVDIAELKRKANTVAIIGRRMALKPEGDHYVGCCPIHGEKTASFKLDKRQGEWLWKCFGCQKGGDVLRFIELVDKVDIKQAIATLEKETITNNPEWLKASEQAAKTITELTTDLKPKATIPLEQWDSYVNRLKNNPAAMKWLMEVRGLNAEVIESTRLGYVQSHKLNIKTEMESCRDKGWIAMPRIQDGKVVSVKLRSIAEKCFTQLPNMDGSALFNVETISAIEPVYLTEGEMDACILEQAGFRAVSVPSAGAKLSPQARIQLKLAERIYLAGDNDGKVGSEYMKNLLRELGTNAHMLVWPEAKDANDFFRDKCDRSIDTFTNQVARLSHKARNTAPEGYSALLDRLRETEDTDMASDPTRVHWMYKDLDDMAYTPAGDVMLIYSTYAGTGKSMLKTQLLLFEAQRGEVVIDLSPEIRGEQYLALVASQVVGPSLEGGLRRTAKIEKKHYLTAAETLDRPTEKGTEFKYYVGHEVNAGSESETLALLEQIIVLTGATRFAIDTFHRLFNDNGKFGQTEAEGRMAKKLEELGKKHKCTFILICQSNAEAEGVENLKKDTLGVLRGSRELRDAAAHIYLIHRKQRAQKDGENPDRTLELDTTVYLRKDRYAGPGKPQAAMLLVEEWSRFVPKAGGHQEPPPQESSEPPSEQFI